VAVTVCINQTCVKAFALSIPSYANGKEGAGVSTTPPQIYGDDIIYTHILRKGLLTAPGDPESVLQVIPTEETWFSMTYAEDREAVESAIQHKLHKASTHQTLGITPPPPKAPFPGFALLGLRQPAAAFPPTACCGCKHGS